MKMSAATRRLYDQMPEPKYVIAMGACMISGGMFSADSPTAVRGSDKILPIDVYIPGCPPRPEAIMDAIIKLRKKIANESLQERSNTRPTHRYYSIPHSMKAVQSTHTGEYLRSPFREKPPTVLAEEMGVPLPELLKQMEPQETSEGMAT